jgi:hypothetical protein
MFGCRSPQPQQKQGWGQRADWGRKDDEPDLDENAMVLGWCKLLKTFMSHVNYHNMSTTFICSSSNIQVDFKYVTYFSSEGYLKCNLNNNVII